MSGVFSGCGRLLRLNLRRDRVYIPVWVIVLAGMVYASAEGTAALYGSVAERVAAAEKINQSAAVVALYGPILDVHSLGEIAMTKMTVLYAVFVAVMNIFMVRRHTRLDEERGQLELLGGTAIGRGAPMAAAYLEAVLVALLLGTLAALAAIGGSLPVGGSLLFGASWAGTALVSAALTLVACQLVPSARTAAAIAAAVIGSFFALRALGDVYSDAAGWLSWLSPLGWNTQLRAWSQPRLWVLGLYVVLSLLLVLAAAGLRSRRDLGAGLFPDRLGPATGSPRLATVVALQLKVLAPMLVGWAVAMAAWGLIFGAMIPGIGSLLDSPQAQDMMKRLGGEGTLQDVMMAAVLSMMAVVVTCFSVAIITHGGDDEQAGRVEEIMSTGVNRSTIFGVTALLALIGPVAMLLIVGLFSGLGWGLAGSTLVIGKLLAAALANAPAIWLVAALTLFAFALRGRLAVVGWAFVVGFLVLGQVAALLKWPHWVTNLSPYEHTPRLPGGHLDWPPIVIMTVLALAVSLAALLLYRRRDIG